MSYIITAEVYTDREENLLGVAENVAARVVSSRSGYIEFDIRGDFGNQNEITKSLCMSLIDAGFLSFGITHSY